METPISTRFTMWKSTRLRVSPGFPALLILAVLAGAGPVLPPMLLAALGHEAGHLLALGIFRVPVEEILLLPLGALIVAPRQERLSYGRELLAVLAGPAANLLLALLSARIWGGYVFAGANVLLGLYNLLPIRGLDGGRALYLLVAWLTEPFTALRWSRIAGWTALAVLVGLAAALVVRTGGGWFFLFGALGMVFSQVRLAKYGGRG